MTLDSRSAEQLTNKRAALDASNVPPTGPSDEAVLMNFDHLMTATFWTSHICPVRGHHHELSLVGWFAQVGATDPTERPDAFMGLFECPVNGRQWSVVGHRAPSRHNRCR